MSEADDSTGGPDGAPQSAATGWRAWRSLIEWTDRTWNPTRGCVKVSPGCKNCYAETFAERWRGTPGHPYERGFDPRLVPEKLGEPLGWRQPSRVFVNSMSDLFGDWVPDAFIAATYGAMAACQHHTFQILTKRAERLPAWYAWVRKREAQGRAMFPDDAPSWRIGQLLATELRRAAGVNGYRKGTRASGWNDYDPRREPWPLPNVQLGVSVEDKKYGVPRIADLRACGGDVPTKFISFEPLLEDLGEVDMSGIAWAIVGLESGRRARSGHVRWVRNVLGLCREQKVPVFIKQLGAHTLDDANAPGWPEGGRVQVIPETSLVRRRLRSPKGGDPSEWPADLRVREFPS